MNEAKILKIAAGLLLTVWMCGLPACGQDEPNVAGREAAATGIPGSESAAAPSNVPKSAVPSAAAIDSGPDPWCRLDDPGHSETERKRLKLKDVGDLVCPTPIDPKQRPDELVLPMPCGRAMVLRKVAVPLRSVLDERKAFFGVVPDSEAEGKPTSAVVSGSRVSFVSGSLSLATNAEASNEIQRGFYLGKYEVTEIQYEIFRLGLLTPDGAHAEATDPACTPIREKATASKNTLVLPATRVSWFDAIEFTRAYTEWLIARDRDRILGGKDPSALPWEESTPAFLRLPTAAEWEYAARGGDVGAAVQSARMHDVVVNGARRRATKDEIASLTTTDNSPVEGSEVHFAGRKLPNPLGMYDMVGNASEIVLDLFQPRRPDQLSSAMGGFVQMGGSASDQGAAIGVGARTEVPMFRRDGIVRSPVVGFRLLLSAPFQVNKRLGDWEEAPGNPDFDQEIERAYQMLDRSGAAGEPESGEAERHIEQVKRDLAQEEQEGQTCQARIDKVLPELDATKSSLERSRAAVSQREAELQLERIRSMILIASNINAVNRQVEVVLRMVVGLQEDINKVADPQKKAQLLAQVADLESRRKQLEDSNEGSFDYYVDATVGMSESPADVVEASQKLLEKQFATQGNTVFNAFQPVVRRHLAAARGFAGRGPDLSAKDGWRDEIYKTQRTH